MNPDTQRFVARIVGSAIAVGIFVAGAAHAIEIDKTLAGALLGGGLLGFGVTLGPALPGVQARIAGGPKATPKL